MMNETWTHEETAIYALVVMCLEQPPKEEEPQELEVIEGEVEEIAPPPLYKRPIPRRWAILLCCCLLVVSTIVSTILILFFTASATITLALSKRPVSFQQTFMLPATRTFPDRVYTLSQTTKATGSGHKDATYATGLVTFYNSLPSPQTVLAGQLLIGADGIHIITDGSAYIPAGSLAINGQVSVIAHVTTVGSQGDIQAGDVSGPCCRDYVFARNSQFSGGQEARDFTVVSQADVASLTNSLSQQLSQQIQQTLLGQIAPTEALTPPLCSQNIIATPNVGQEAETVTVRVTRTCSAASYDQTTLMDQAQKQLHHLIQMQFSPSYIPVGKPQVRILSTSVKENTVKISALVNGTMIYHFRKADMDKLKRLVAGKSKEQAGQIILKWQDIQLVGIQLQFNQESLPSDPERITVRVKP